ncbi:orotidine-5'-phosphate decarboxylase [Frigoribacterium sp. CG_9.8]|uniref:orotidine-5'-phosphate decarboxylase n=1 Tax=Frigoribacterium sp. CG_9.8 TaxID=2787733 RepID=UPI0018CAB6A8|nr:orotidine-5'-phosphate decarboxylase [Frigoribacterium sp. CG_9.8]
MRSQASFGDRLVEAFDRFGQLCVGIDPHPYLLQRWDLPDDASGLRQFGLRVIDAAAGQVGIVKPQIAFFERHGSAGYAALESILDSARQAGLLVIADAKRGDLGTSVEAYAQAWFAAGSPLEVDALTISAYMGLGSIEAPMTLAEKLGKGLFVLAATSNPEALSLQTARISSGLHAGQSVASSIVSGVGEWNFSVGAGSVEFAPTLRPVGSIGLVLGATVDFTAFGLDLSSIASAPSSPVLAPGFGHQGAQFADLHRLYGPAAPVTIVAASRSILNAGPDGISDAIRMQASEVFSCRA